MSLISKLAWLVLPTLAGSSVLSQVSSQGAGTNAGGKANLVVWNGKPVPEEDLVQLKPESDGTLRIPVTTADGNVNPFWRLNPSSFFDKPIEAGKAASLAVGAADSKIPVIISKPESQGVLSSKKFEITHDMKKLQMRIIGNGDMTSTYVSLTVSIDGNPSLKWSQQAPTSTRIFDNIDWDLAKISERAGGKRVVAKIDLVDGGKSEVIGVGEVSAGNITSALSPRTSTGRAFFSFANLFLAANNRSYKNYPSLVRDGQQYAKHFGVQPIDSGMNFGMPKEDMYAVLVEVNKLVASPQFDHNPSLWKQLPVRLTNAALEVAVSKATELGHNLSDPKHKADFDYFVKLQAIHEWVRSRYIYDMDITTGKAPRIDFRVAMSSPKPAGVCGDISWAVVYFASLAGLDNVHKVEGSHKRNGDGIAHTFDHSWNAAILPSGSMTFADVVRSYYPVESGIRKRNGFSFTPFGFGIEDWQQGFFLQYYHNQTVITGKKSSADVDPIWLTPTSRQFGTTSGIDYFTGQTWERWYGLRMPVSFTEAFNLYYSLF